MMKRKPNLSEKIKKSRLEMAWSQKELANAIGLSDRSISAYETNRVQPPLEIIERIAAKVGKPVSYFTDENPPDYVIETKLKRIEKELAEVKKLLKKNQK